MKYPKGDFVALLLAVLAHENKTHPVRAYLDSLNGTVSGDSAE